MGDLCVSLGTAIYLLGTNVTVSWNQPLDNSRWQEKYKANVNMVELVKIYVQGDKKKLDLPMSAKINKGVWEYTPMFNKFIKVTLPHTPKTKPYVVCGEYGCKTLPEMLPRINENDVAEIVTCTRM